MKCAAPLGECYAGPVFLPALEDRERSGEIAPREGRECFLVGGDASVGFTRFALLTEQLVNLDCLALSFNRDDIK